MYKSIIPTIVLGVALNAIPTHAQTSATGTASKAVDEGLWKTPRTEHGHPDLQGIWLFGSRTPFQRPKNLGDKQSYSPEEVQALEQRMHVRNLQQDQPLDASRPAPELGARIGQEADDAFLAHYRKAEIVPVDGEYRTSVITDPKNGRLPLRESFMDYHAKVRAAELADTDGPEGQPLSGRCLIFGSAVPSLTPIMMNPNLQIVQNKDYVMIMTEMVHDARVIRLQDKHFDSKVQQWMGDSIGHWEGDTLVVHTKNFRPEQSSRRGMLMSEDFELVEKYTRVADGEIRYSFTATDELAYTQAVSGVRTLTRNSSDERIYEFACHEGNYSLSSILAGARRVESEQTN